MSEVQGRTALVTGAGRGIGRAVALSLAKEGVRVALAARSELELGAVESLIQAKGLSSGVYRLDVTDDDACRRVVDAVTADLGPIDILVNNAGIAESAPLHRTTDEMWDRMMTVNVRAPFLLTRLVTPGMVERGWGRVINIASTAAQKGYAYTSAYVASKHALLGMTRAHAKEVVGSGVTVNAVCPGYTMTDLVRESARKVAQKTGGVLEDVISQFAAASPLNRLIDPFEVARAVLWCVGPDSAALTGQALGVSGGETEA